VDLPSQRKRYSVNLYSLLLPILVLAALVIAGTTGKIGFKRPQQEKSDVLSSGSGNGGDDDEDEDNEDEDSDEGDSDGNESEDNDSDSDRDDEGNDSEDENELEDKDDEDETRETITNPDGTTTEIRRETEGDETKVEFRTFDAAGNKIMVEKFESKEGEEKSRVKTYDASGTKLTDLRLETEDGKEIEFRVKEGETELSRVKFDAEDQKLVIRTDDEANSLIIKTSGNNFVLTRGGINALSNFPITIDDETGQTFVKTPNGNIELKVMPDSIVERAQLAATIVGDEDLELSSGDELEYRLAGAKSEKLLGIFQVKIPSQLIYSAETGELLKSEQGFITKVLDLFSF